MSAEIFKKVTIGDKDFTIKKFDSKTAMKLARLVMSKLSPIIPMLSSDGNGPDVSDTSSYQAVFAVLGALSDEDIDGLVDKCLRFCYADLPAGLAPIIDESGNYGVEDVEYDLGLTLALCYEAIKWGASDFFGGNRSISSLFKR